MLFRIILYVMVGYFIYRVIQVASRMKSTGRRAQDEGQSHPPEPHIPDFKDIKDADFIDITPKDKDAGNTAGS